MVGPVSSATTERAVFDVASLFPMNSCLLRVYLKSAVAVDNLCISVRVDFNVHLEETIDY
jgi:hypothetical protein